MKTPPFAAGMTLSCLTLCVSCTSAPVTPAPVIISSACPRVTLCPMPGSDPHTNGDLSADIRQLEHALIACALQVETVKHCQDELDAKTH